MPKKDVRSPYLNHQIPKAVFAVQFSEDKKRPTIADFLQENAPLPIRLAHVWFPAKELVLPIINTVHEPKGKKSIAEPWQWWPVDARPY